MKKITTCLLCFTCFVFMANAQITAADLQGHWILTNLEGNDTAIALSASEKAALTENYSIDLPLTLTTIDFSGSNFVMVHHGDRSMNGSFTVTDSKLTLHALPNSNCSECDVKDFLFHIRSFSSAELVLDIFDGDEGSSGYAHLVLSK